MAEGEGFEPPEGHPSTVFKTAAFDHSATPPKRPKRIPEIHLESTLLTRHINISDFMMPRNGFFHAENIFSHAQAFFVTCSYAFASSALIAFYFWPVAHCERPSSDHNSNIHLG